MSSNMESTRAVGMQQWISTVQDCKASGKSNVTYCAEQGINIKTFYYWQKKLHQETAGKLEQRKPMLAKSSKEIVHVDFSATPRSEITIRKACSVAYSQSKKNQGRADGKSASLRSKLHFGG